MDDPQSDGVPDFEYAYTRHRAAVYAIAFAIVRNPIDAEDVVQTTFLKVWRAPRAFRGGNLGAWIAVLAKHCAIDVIRARRFEVQDLCVDRLQTASSGSDVESVVLRELEYRWLDRAMERLSDDDRSLLRMSFVERASHRRIAAAARLPLGTVKSRIRSSLARLRRAAEGAGEPLYQSA